MTFTQIHKKLMSDRGLSITEANEVISKTLNRSLPTIQGYHCASREIPSNSLKLLNLALKR